MADSKAKISFPGPTKKEAEKLAEPEPRHEQQAAEVPAEQLIAVPLSQVDSYLKNSIEWPTRALDLTQLDKLRPTTQSTLIALTCKVTSNFTARVTVDSVTLPVTLAVTLTVRPNRRTADFASQFRPAPAPLETLSDTPPRPLIPPSQPRREGSASGTGKNRLKKG